MTIRALIRSAATAAGLAGLTALAIAAAASAPAMVPATADPAAFSAARAMEHVRMIARRPHPGGTTEHDRAREYIRSRLEQLGVDATVQDVTGVGTRYPAAGRVRNIVGVIPGSVAGSHMVLLMAHYDGVPAAPAAGDDASGSAVLLEVARALTSGPRLRNDVVLLFTDGEEAGLLGAAAFVRDHPLAQRIGVTLNFEARGTRGPSLMFETGPGNLDVARMLRQAPGARATSLSTTVYRQLPNDTDLSEIALLARPALNFAFIGGAERYHTSQDDLAHLDGRSVQHHGNQALALARAFGSEPLPRPITGDGVFFDLPVIGVVAYPVAWAMAMAAITLALVVVLVGRLRRSDPRWLRGLVIGAVATIGAAVLAGGVGMLVSAAIHRFHAALGTGSPTFSGVYLAGLTLVAVAVTTGLFALVARRVPAQSLFAAAVTTWSLLALVVSAIAPGVSFLFAWPALFGVLAALARGPARRSVVDRAAGWTLAAVTVFIVAPTLYLMAGVALGLGGVAAVVVSTISALAVWLLAPLLDDIAALSRWFAPVAAGGAAIALLAVGAATVRHDDSNPTRATLVYAADADGGGAWLTGLAAPGSGRSWIRSVLASARPDADSANRPDWLPAAYAATGMTPVTPAQIPAPRFQLLRNESDGVGRSVTARILAPAGTLGITLAMNDALVKGARVGGIPIERSRYRQPPGGRWRLDFYAPHDTGFVVDLTLAAADSADVSLVARLPGLPPLGSAIAPRPVGVLESQGGDATLIHRRVRF